MGMFGIAVTWFLMGSGLGVGFKVGDFVGKKITKKVDDLALSFKTETKSNVIEIGKKRSPSEKKD